MYTARGSVLVEQGETIMMANEMKYDEKTSKYFPEGNVVYDSLIYCLKQKRQNSILIQKGTFYNAEIFQNTKVPRLGHRDRKEGGKGILH